MGSLAGNLDVKSQTGGTTKQDFPNGMVMAYRVVTLSKTGWWWDRHITVQGILPFGGGTTTPTDEDYFVRIPDS